MLDQIYYMEGFELEVEERLVQLLKPELFDLIRG
jgi:hypothetical protein